MSREWQPRQRDIDAAYAAWNAAFWQRKRENWAYTESLGAGGTFEASVPRQKA